MTDYSTKTPYQFDRAIFLPFKMEQGGFGFVLKSAVFYMLANTILLLLFGKWLLGYILNFIQMAERIDTSASEDEIGTATMDMVSSMFGMFLPMMLWGLLIWLVWVMITAEMHRRNLRGQANAGVFIWRLGKDELRVILSQLLFGVIMSGVVMGLYLAVALAGVLASLGSQISAAASALLILLALLVGIAALAGSIYLALRLAPLSATSIAEEEISIGKSWGMLTGRTWPTLGAYTLLYVLSMVVNYIVQIIVLFTLFSSMLPMIAELETAGDNSEEVLRVLGETFLTPGFLTSFVIGIAALSLVQCIWRLCISGVANHLVWLKQQEPS